jgi:hypothetical protein
MHWGSNFNNDKEGKKTDHHPPVKIHWPSLECACGGRLGGVTPRGAGGGQAAGDHSNAASISSERELRAPEEEVKEEESVCRAGDKGSWILSVSGLIPSFLRLYMLEFNWSLQGEDPQKNNRVHVLAAAAFISTYRFRIPFSESGEDGTSLFDLI